MAIDESIYQYVEFDAPALLQRSVTEPLRISDIDQSVWRLLGNQGVGLSQEDYTIDSLPLVTFQPAEPTTPPVRLPIRQKVFSVRSPNVDAAERFRNAVRKSIGSSGKEFQAVATNPAISVGDYSMPLAPDAAAFGTLDDARSLVCANSLPDGLDGSEVNVVLIDAGIDKTMFPAQFVGGWHPDPQGPALPTPPLPGETTGENALHGMMIVNNIRAFAPKARIFDVPLIPPPNIYDVPSFLVVADAIFDKILCDIQAYQAHGCYPGPWVFMNAWAIFDRRSEAPHLGEYTENLGPGGVPPHPFIQRIINVANEKFDIVFCAGNCGEVCPDGRCGPDDYGPGRSIWGANAHEDVLTVGAVRVDGIWCGYSSEGPGPTPNLVAKKPDLCAPSQFVGPGGLYPLNSGTSAASGFTAGVVCALRSKLGWDQTTVPPFILKMILNNTARQLLAPSWNQWLGNGILDVDAAYKILKKWF